MDRMLALEHVYRMSEVPAGHKVAPGATGNAVPHGTAQMPAAHVVAERVCDVDASGTVPLRVGGVATDHGLAGSPGALRRLRAAGEGNAR